MSYSCATPTALPSSEKCEQNLAFPNPNTAALWNGGKSREQLHMRCDKPSPPRTDGASAAPGGTPGMEGAGEGQGTGQPGQRRDAGRGRVAVCMCFCSLWIFECMPGGNGISLKPPGLRCPPTKLKSSFRCACVKIFDVRGCN